VVAIDIQESRLEVARKLGADFVIDGSTQNVPEELRKIAPEGADVVFESTGIPACLDPAIELCRPYGKFVLQGNYGQAPISYHFLPPHGKRLTMFYPCDDGFVPCRRAALKNMAMGVLPWHHTITHRVEAGEAPALYDAVNRGEAGDVLGAVIRWS
jgi:threonine dehydrogenase-like Zn-dependent dehydrogenase